ncbi:MAG: hypothetical protein QY307_05050 [Acidimicrobiia bacterium]|nr:MAG: hypothetical protein QY307_05050 [Acidimicrobiia bacterium]
MLHVLNLQAEPGGPTLPDDAGAALVWLVFAGIITGLWILVSRTRRRAEREFWERKRRQNG